VIHCQTLTRRIKGKLCTGDERRLVVIRSDHEKAGAWVVITMEADLCNLNYVLHAISQAHPSAFMPIDK